MEHRSGSGLAATAALAATSLLAATAIAISPGNSAAGKLVFESQCGACHTVESGNSGIGPSLRGVIGRKAASLPGYDYSSALSNSGLTWDVDTLDDFLRSSSSKVPGSPMAIAISDASERADLIAYLATVGTSAKPSANPP